MYSCRRALRIAYCDAGQCGLRVWAERPALQGTVDGAENALLSGGMAPNTSLQSDKAKLSCPLLAQGPRQLSFAAELVR